ncbi:MAG TPA: DUF5615 family PIN-like protein [Candidatus Marinimicrobia bacterium]|jgi:predicted nuclease of predicted toxin-antitoxin system|nr:DUF5615 family PIN-like protein [Candidatus Neomarinimicrobiota bacterium]
MIFFLDENFPKAVTSILIKEGHKVIDLRGTDQEGLEDEELFKIVQKNKAIFLTTDKDYFHTIPYLFKSHFGVIIITLKKPSRKNIIDRLKWLLSNIDLELMQNKVILLKDKSYMINKE